MVSKLRRLEKEIFLLKKEEDWQNEEELSSEIKSLEKQVKKNILMNIFYLKCLKMYYMNFKI